MHTHKSVDSPWGERKIVLSFHVLSPRLSFESIEGTATCSRHRDIDTRARICLIRATIRSPSLSLSPALRRIHIVLHSLPMATGQDKLQIFLLLFVLLFGSSMALCRLNGFSPLDIKLSLSACYCGRNVSRGIHNFSGVHTCNAPGFFPRATPRWIFFPFCSPFHFPLLLFS